MIKINKSVSTSSIERTSEDELLVEVVEIINNKGNYIVLWNKQDIDTFINNYKI